MALLLVTGPAARAAEPLHVPPLASPFACAASAVTTMVAADSAPVLAPALARELGVARLAGQGRYTWFSLELYSIEFWVGAAGYVPSRPDAAPLALNLHYARTLSGRKIAAASVDEITRLGFGSPAQRAVWLEKMAAFLPDVRKGTHLSGLYLPGFGVRFYQGEKVLGEVADSEFGHAFFAIWLSPASSAPGLRQALLRNAAPEPAPETVEMSCP